MPIADKPLNIIIQLVESKPHFPNSRTILSELKVGNYSGREFAAKEKTFKVTENTDCAYLNLHFNKNLAKQPQTISVLFSGFSGAATAEVFLKRIGSRSTRNLINYPTQTLAASSLPVFGSLEDWEFIEVDDNQTIQIELEPGQEYNITLKNNVMANAYGQDSQLISKALFSGIELELCFSKK